MDQLLLDHDLIKNELQIDDDRAPFFRSLFLRLRQIALAKEILHGILGTGAVRSSNGMMACSVCHKTLTGEGEDICADEHGNALHSHCHNRRAIPRIEVTGLETSTV